MLTVVVTASFTLLPSVPALPTSVPMAVQHDMHLKEAVVVALYAKLAATGT